jgi:hypothetical protein
MGDGGWGAGEGRELPDHHQTTHSRPSSVVPLAVRVLPLPLPLPPHTRAGGLAVVVGVVAGSPEAVGANRATALVKVSIRRVAELGYGPAVRCTR